MKNEDKRVIKYEKKYLKINKLLNKLEKDLDNYLLMKNDLIELSNYYEEDWQKDYDNSKINANILSQDSLWDMFELDNNIKLTMKKIINDKE